jgi:hypothetical protein
MPVCDGVVLGITYKGTPLVPLLVERLTSPHGKENMSSAEEGSVTDKDHLDGHPRTKDPYPIDHKTEPIDRG